MRIELDKPLTKTRLRQALKMMGNEGKKIKIIMGTEIFDIDTIVSKNDTIYLCTDSQETSDFYEKRVIDLSGEEDDVLELDAAPCGWRYPNMYSINFDEIPDEKWEELRERHKFIKYRW